MSTTLVPTLGNRPAPLDPAFLKELSESIRQRHHIHIKSDERLTLSGEISHGHALIHLQLEKRDRSELFSLESVVELEINHIEKPSDARDIAVDFTDMILHRFFENGRTIPYCEGWIPYEFEEVHVIMRGGITRPFAEESADKFLANAGFDVDGDPL